MQAAPASFDVGAMGDEEILKIGYCSPLDLLNRNRITLTRGICVSHMNNFMFSWGAAAAGVAGGGLLTTHTNL